jgi:hypothetical protein
MRLILAVLLLAAVSGVRADVDLALREDGVLYFEDNLPTHLLATVQSPTTVYLRRDLQTPLASLFAGQKIEIIGMSPEGFMIKGTYRNNSITGWISPGELPSDVDRAQIALAKKNQERRGQIAAVIARKQVIRGMTPDEVHQSLGDPDQTSSHTDGSGTSQIWVYTTYANVWQTSYVAGPFGRPVLQSFPVRTPVGQIAVTFTDNEVSAIEQHQTSPAAAAASASPN